MKYDQLEFIVLDHYIKQADGPQQEQDPNEDVSENPRILQVTADLIDGGMLDGRVVLAPHGVGAIIVIGPTLLGREMITAMRAESNRGTPIGRLRQGGIALVKAIATWLRLRR